MDLADLTWPEVKALSPDTPVVIPVAAIEQHGHHLPVSTDSDLLGEVVRRVKLAVADSILFTPLQWLGNSHHHLDFPGTLSAAPRTYLDLLGDLAENLLHHGFRRIVFLNGHGGNIVPGRQTIFELRQRYRSRRDLLLLMATYWDFAKPWETNPQLHQREMGHACEWETSMMLRLCPERVRDRSLVGTVPFGSAFQPASRGWVMHDRSQPGHIGLPEFASAEKGEHLFASFAAGVVQFLDEVRRWDGSRWGD